MRDRHTRKKARISYESKKTTNTARTSRIATKTTKKKSRMIEMYSVLILISTLFMGIGYAEISSTKMDISGVADATTQDGVFITDIINQASDSNTNEADSSIDYFLASTVKSSVVLGNDSNSYISYKVSMYNNTELEQVFIETLTDKTNTDYYSNSNIEFTLEGIEKYKTVIAPGSSLDFTITFKYVGGADVTKNTLESILNFRFQPLPKLELDNDTQVYELNDIYPDYTPQEYTFKVSNYDANGIINSVPLTYTLVQTIDSDSPIITKIYDQSGNPVEGDITIAGDGTTKVDQTYTLKVIWDNSKVTDYNDPKYAGKSYTCNVDLVAVTNNEKYLDYKIEKGFDINIKTATFDFVPAVEDAEIVIKDGTANLVMTLKNYSSSTQYNKYNTTYEITLENNSKLSITLDDTNSGTLKGNATNTNTINVKFTGDMDALDLTETATLRIKAKSPYITEETLPVTLNFHKVTVTLDPGYGSVTTTSFVTYKNRTYDGLVDPYWKSHVFDGWYTSKTGGTKIESTTEVTTDSSTQTLYAHWTSLLLADNVNVGDYVDYPVTYTNVATRSDGTQIPESTYTRWRVICIEGEENHRYVKLITEGVPMAYKHPHDTSDTTVGSTSVKNLTTGFFNTAITTTQTNNKFYLCGFKNASGGSITTITQLKNLFINDYTQTSSDGTPKVQSVTKDDMDNALGQKSENVSDVRGLMNNLFAIPATSASQGDGYGYAGYYLATVEQNYYIWNSYYSGYIVYTYGINGVRPVVTLKETLEHDGKVDGAWQMKIVD